MNRKKSANKSIFAIALLLVLTMSLSLLTACGAAKPAATEKTAVAKTEAAKTEAKATAAKTEAAKTEAKATAAKTEAPKTEAKAVTLKVGCSPSPHAEILKLVQEDLKAEGITLKIEEYSDYVIPNNALAEGGIDANFFQHIPYFDDFKTKNKLKLEVLCGVHIEPMGVFSKKVKSLDDLKEGAEIMIPNDTVNGGRALLLLQAKGLIKIKSDVTVGATEKDIVENKKKLKFTPLEAAAIPRTYADVDAAVINGNYAIENGLNPVKDSIAIEGAESPYVNIVAVREGDAAKAEYQKLAKALQSPKVKKFIEDKYAGSVVPAFTDAKGKAVK